MIHEETYKGHHIEIYQDEDPMNPREDFDPIGHMVCWHRRYALGDKHSYSDPEDLFRSIALEIDPSLKNQFYELEDLDREEEIPALISKTIESAAILEIYLYDHSGITISCSQFSCPWDSGQVGVIYMTPEEMKVCGLVSRAETEKYLKSEVKTYDDYLTGNVYGYSINNGEMGCSGFYGEEPIDEARYEVDFHVGKGFYTDDASIFEEFGISPLGEGSLYFVSLDRKEAYPTDEDEEILPNPRTYLQIKFL
jgi:hypothetical protein